MICISYNISCFYGWVLEKKMKYYNKNALIIQKNIIIIEFSYKYNYNTNDG